MQKLIDYIETIVKLDTEAIQRLNELAVIESYAKNQHLLEAGQRCNKIWFLQSGMVRKYHINDGKEHTCWIHTEDDIFTSLKSYSQQIYSEEYIQACEDSVVIGISRENSKKLATIPQFLTFSNTLMERAFVNIDIHTKEFNLRDAKGKYEYLKTIEPEMVKKAKLGHIASILGISQETLSRIRKG